MDENYLKEKLNSIHTEMNHLWTGMLVTFGGMVGFIVFENKTIYSNSFVVLGAVLGLLFLNAYIVRRIELKDILKQIKKGDV